MSEKPWSANAPKVKFGYSEDAMRSYPLTEEGITKAIDDFPPFEGLSLKDALDDDDSLVGQRLCVVYDLLCTMVQTAIDGNNISQENLDYVMPLVDHAAKLYRDDLMDLSQQYAMQRQGLTEEFTVTQDLVKLHDQMVEDGLNDDEKAFLGLIYYVVSANTGVDPLDLVEEETRQLFANDVKASLVLN